MYILWWYEDSISCIANAVLLQERKIGCNQKLSRVGLCALRIWLMCCKLNYQIYGGRAHMRLVLLKCSKYSIIR